MPPCFADRHGNAYLLPGTASADTALVDPGPDTSESRQALTEAMAAAGLAPASLRLLVVTSWQAERSGLVGWLSSRGGVTVVARGGVNGMARALADAARSDQALETAVRWGGAPTWALERLKELLGGRRAYQPAWRPMAGQRWLDPRPGTGVRLGGKLWEPRYPLLRSASLATYWHAASRTLLGGDVLDRAPGLRLPLPQPLQDWPDILKQVMGSWRQSGRETMDLILPGQGAPIRSHRVLIARRLAQIKVHMTGILAATAGEALSPWDLMLRLDPERLEDADLPERLAGLLVMVAHLERRGRLRREGPGAAGRFRSTTGGRLPG